MTTPRIQRELWINSNKRSLVKDSHIHCCDSRSGNPDTRPGCRMCLISPYEEPPEQGNRLQCEFAFQRTLAAMDAHGWRITGPVSGPWRAQQSTLTSESRELRALNNRKEREVSRQSQPLWTMTISRGPHRAAAPGRWEWVSSPYMDSSWPGSLIRLQQCSIPHTWRTRKPIRYRMIPLQSPAAARESFLILKCFHVDIQLEKYEGKSRWFY